MINKKWLRVVYAMAAATFVATAAPVIMANAEDVVTAVAVIDEVAEEEVPEVSEEDLEYDGYTYRVEKGAAIITGYKYKDDVTKLEIVEQIGSYYVEGIDGWAFEGFENLEEVTIPKTVISLGRGVFKNCTKLKKVTINGDIAACDGHAVGGYSPDYSVFYNAGNKLNGLEVEFAGNASKVPAYMFATNGNKDNNVYCHISKLTIGKTVKTIDEYALLNCYDLKEVVFAEGGVFESIGLDAFESCDGIETIKFPTTIKSIGQGAFFKCAGLKALTFTGDYVLETIDGWAFQDCTALETAEIPKTVTALGRGVFKNCTKLKKVTIYGDLAACDGHSVGGYSPDYSVFYNTGNKLDGLEIEFAGDASKVPAYIFATNSSKDGNVYCHISKLTIGSKVKTIDEYALLNCYDLKDVVFTDNGAFESIGKDAFESCDGIETIKFPNTIKSIGQGAFFKCAGLKALTFTGDYVLETIDGWAFQDCTALETVEIPKTVTALGRGVFKNCTKLKKVTINGDIAACDGHSVGGYSPDYSVFYNTGNRIDGLEIEFAKNVTLIPAYMFATNSNKDGNVYCHITKLKLPVSLEKIGTHCLLNCHDLREIEFEGTEARWDKLVSEIEGEGENPFTYLDENGIVYTFGNLPYGKEAPVLTCVKGQKNVKFAEAAKTKADGKSYKIVVSDRRVATMSKKGVVNCKSEGTTDITVTKAGGAVFVYHIKVVDPGSYKKSYKISAGQTQALDFNIDKSLFRVEYVSSKTNVATVDDKGVVNGLAKGKTKIMIRVYAKDMGGNEVLAKTYNVTIKVKG